MRLRIHRLMYSGGQTPPLRKIKTQLSWILNFKFQIQRTNAWFLREAATEGNFSEHRKSGSRPGTKSIKLRHGRASVGDTQVRLTLRIGLDEVDVIPSQVIEDESKEASAFIEGMYDDAFGY